MQGNNLELKNLPQFIDHTLLKPEATESQHRLLCQEAKEFGFATICINSKWLPFCVQELGTSKVKPICVIGFPLGACSTDVKVYETEWCVKNGALEIDMVISVGSLKSGDLNFVENDIRSVVKAANGKPVKVIIETGLLTLEEKKLACELSVKAGAHFVKTCTGFGPGVATIEDIQLMKSIVKDACLIKASGGIKTFEQAAQLIQAGASRLGTSSGVALVKGLTINPSSY
jgi:deoxyribose-phosphate aldolase